MTDEALTPELLLQAYAAGIFPMAESRDSDEVFWVDPRDRGVFPLEGFHVSRSLGRSLRKNDYEIATNRDFEAVIDACADRPETWINETIRDLCLALHGSGDAHSLEVRRDGKLIGGVYGIALGTAFFGESMFSRASDASKIALAYLIDRLRLKGFTLFDTQFLTPHLARLGAVEIARDHYRARLRAALASQAEFPGPEPFPEPQELVQRITQTS